MTLSLPVYRLTRSVGASGRNQWCAHALSRQAAAVAEAAHLAELADHLRGQHGADAECGLVVDRAPVSWRHLAEADRAAWWLSAEEEWAHPSALDLFWRADLTVCAFRSRLGPVPAELPPDMPIHEAVRAWLLANAVSPLPAVHRVDRPSSLVPDEAAFGAAQNLVLRRWIDSGDPAGMVARIREREKECAATMEARMRQMRVTLVQRVEAANPGAGADAAFGEPPGAVLHETVEVDALEAALSRADAVTIDLFDTVLMRKVGKPVDVFWLVGRQIEASTGLSAGEFALLRAQAEQDVRAEALSARHAEDITLAAIYARIAEKLKASAEVLQEWAAIEVGLEERLLMVHPEFARHRELLRPKLRLCLSEMYLPETKLAQWLHEKVGFPEVPLWSSGGTGLSKGGGLYAKAREALDHTADRLLHIGDNVSSDIEAASRAGWNTFLWRARRSCRLDQPNRWVPEDPLSSIAVGLLRAERNDEAPLAWQVGFELLGPIVFAWIHHLAGAPAIRQAEQIWMLARDGYWVERVWKQLPHGYQPGGQRRYVWGSRQLWGIAVIEDISADDWDFLLKAAPDLRTRDFFERVGMRPDDLDPDPDLPWDRVLTNAAGFIDPSMRDALYRLFVRNIHAFHDVRQPRRERVMEYLRSLNPQGHGVALVDLGWHGSSCAQISRLAASAGWKRPRGHYFATWPEAESVLRGGADCYGFFVNLGCSPERVRLLRESVDLLECLFSAPHPAVKDVTRGTDGHAPIEMDTDPRPASQIVALESIWEGATAFCKAMTELVPVPGPESAAPLAHRALERLLRAPQTAEAALFADWRHVEGWGVNRSLRLIESAPPQAAVAELYTRADQSRWLRGWWALLGPGHRNRLLTNGFPRRST